MNTIFHTLRDHSLSFFALFIFSLSLFSSPVYAESEARENSVIIDNGDLLYVIIPKEVTSEFSPTERNYFKEKVEVDRHGYIFLPSQGNIKISGYTTDQIGTLLTNNLPKYLSKSDKASVNLIEKRHYIQIIGHVQTPGWYNISESADIQAILSRAGGALEGADLSKVTINRKENAGAKQIRVDIQKYLVKGDSSILPSLHENDVIFVPLQVVAANTMSSTPTNSAQIRIFGAVNSPGIYPAAKGMNLLDLLITAKGEAVDADLSKIKIMRADGKREIFNMQALLDGEATKKRVKFPKVYGGDIVHITRSASQIIDAETGLKTAQSITITGPGSNGKGLRAFTDPMTPLEAISQAGGVSDFADTNDIVIIRRVDGKQKRFDYDYDKALMGEMPDVDFQLEAGDIIFIP